MSKKILNFKPILLLIICLVVFSCKKNTNNNQLQEPEKRQVVAVPLKYATGFEIEKYTDHTLIKIINPWPGSDKIYTYVLTENHLVTNRFTAFDAVINTPLSSVVVTSTTHIPSLEMLEVENSLVGFPNLAYISSKKTRQRIAQNKIKELGRNEAINTEVLIELSPDAVVSFAIDDDNKSLEIIKKTGIPVLINADWTETHPLGKAEWIKFFGALYGKEKEADSIFNSIERNYLGAKESAKKTTIKPTVLSGAMYKDVWYLPQGNSWAAQFIDDANGDYLWSNSKGTGSLSLNIESVLDQGQGAEYWIGPGQFTSKKQMLENASVYGQFDAFKNDKVFSFTNKKGATGGVLYYELAPNRPDIVLKDIIKILHPELLPEHELFFFTPVE
jgi:iron complex transport system substrate-binding protein